MSITLITGGAGSLGQVLCQKLIDSGDKVRVMDIDESALAAMNYPPERFTKIYDDVSDYFRVFKAMKGCDKVYHCAAMKNLIVTEWNAPACIRVNVKGVENIADAAIEHGLKQAVFLSSDKSVEASNLYGGTKLLGEQYWKFSARIQNKTIFTIVRSGNFFTSKGNVFEYWDELYKQGKPLPITDADMERYFIETDDIADIVLSLPANYELNGAVIIPKMKEYNLLNLMLLKYGDDVSFITTGKRQGEKLREKLRYDDETVIYETDMYEVVK